MKKLNLQEFNFRVSQTKLAVVGLRRCCMCNETKTIDSFEKWKHNKVGRKSVCKDCRKIERKKLKTRKELLGGVGFIIGEKLKNSTKHAKKLGYMACTATIDELIPIYTTSCQICKKECGNSISMDHCHETGRFRGFLCYRCNYLLGCVERQLDLERLIAYITK